MSNTYCAREPVLAVLVLAVVCAVSAEADRPPETASAKAAYTLSTDPDVVVLSVVSRYQPNLLRSLELRGDGDLRLSSRPPLPGQAGRYRLRLEYREMVELLEVAVSAGLVEATVEDIEGKRAMNRFRASIYPPGTVEVAVNLATYTRDGRTRRDLKNTVEYGARYAQSYPEIPEIRGLEALSERIDALFYRASGTQPPPPEPELEFGPLVRQADPEPAPGTIERLTEHGHFELAKRHLPLSELVHLGFFPRIESMLSHNGTVRSTILRETFAVEESSAEEEALLEAIRAAEAARPTEDDGIHRAEVLHELRARYGNDAAMRRNLEFMEEDARRFGVVWGQMVVGLGGPNSPAMVKMKEFVERSREGRSLVAGRSFEDPDHTIWKLERAFQEGVNTTAGEPQ